MFAFLSIARWSYSHKRRLPGSCSIRPSRPCRRKRNRSRARHRRERLCHKREMKPRMNASKRKFGLVILALASLPGFAQTLPLPASKLPLELEGVGIDEHLGREIDLDL